MKTALAATFCLAVNCAFAQSVVTPAEIAGKYFVAADAFETRVVHPMWQRDRLVVEDIRLIGNLPLVGAHLPPAAKGRGVSHPASMARGVLVYMAPALFGGTQPQTVIFYRTEGPATGGIHAIVTFEGPPEGAPSTWEALARTEQEWLTAAEPTEAPCSEREP
jgi:hypothetical protein